MFSLHKDLKVKCKWSERKHLNVEKQLHFLSEADEIDLKKPPAFAKDK